VVAVVADLRHQQRQRPAAPRDGDAQDLVAGPAALGAATAGMIVSNIMDQAYAEPIDLDLLARVAVSSANVRSAAVSCSAVSCRAPTS